MRRPHALAACLLHRPHVLQHAGLLKGAVQFVKQTVEVMRWDRVEGLAEVIVTVVR